MSIIVTALYSLLQVVEDGYEFFAKRQLVTLFSAPNYCGEFDNAGGMMSVDESLMCSFQVIFLETYSVSDYFGYFTLGLICYNVLVGTWLTIFDALGPIMYSACGFAKSCVVAVFKNTGTTQYYRKKAQSQTAKRL